MRKVIVDIIVRATILVDEGVEISEIVDELDYDFTDTTTKATIEDTEITDTVVIDSR
jgi:hypothetical protein